MVKDYSRHSTTLTLTQMLYDGFATRNEVKRLDHARQVRLFELLDISENVALEAARAYVDVLRFRKLVALAEDNYIRHRAVFEQIQKTPSVDLAIPYVYSYRAGQDRKTEESQDERRAARGVQIDVARIDSGQRALDPSDVEMLARIIQA